MSNWHDPNVSIAGAHDASASTQHDSYLSANHDPATTWIHDGIRSAYHDPAISTGGAHDPDVSLGHDSFFSQEHDPSTSWAHDGAVSSWHDPTVSIGGSHDAATSTGHTATTSKAHDPALSADYGSDDDAVIDGDGTSTNSTGLPGAQEVASGDVLTTFESSFSGNRTFDILMYDFDSNKMWSVGDALVLEGGTIDGVYKAATDVIILAGSGNISTDDSADFQLLITGNLLGLLFHDAYSDSSWDNGEDIVLDANHNDEYLAP